ncbi:MAG: hypothetical protein ACJAY8_000658 [Sphingobacteriales bacterium]|jgi:hypothetical protein
MSEIVFEDRKSKTIQRINIQSPEAATELRKKINDLDPNYWESLSPIQEFLAMQSFKKQLQGQ